MEITFPEFSLKHTPQDKELQLMTNFKIEYAHKIDDSNEIKVKIILTMQDSDELFKLHLITLGFFQLDIDDKLSDDNKKNLIKNQTFNEMMPFIRTQVTLMTTQPGMTPIFLKNVDIETLSNTE